MILSQTSEIALRAVAYLVARKEAQTGVTARDLSRSIAANQHTVAKAMQVLVKQGVVSSSRGPAGGFYLTSSQQNKPIINIVTAIDGNAVFEQCIIGLSKCSNDQPCPIHAAYRGVRDDISRIFSETIIKDIPFNFEIKNANIS